MKIFVTDTETTGLSSKEDNLIEVAGCIFDIETQTILESYQTLLYSTENACESINHISPKALQSVEKDQIAVAQPIIQDMADMCDFVVAHNAPFDKAFYEANDFVFKTPWVCSKSDITYPGKHTSSRLGHLCYDFDIPVLKAHSALHDVYILIELLKKVPNLTEQLNHAHEPKKPYKALVGFENKDLAKDKGFSWDKSLKMWIKELRENEVEKIKEEGLFNIVEI